MHTFAKGARVGRYTIVEPLGRGKMGAVFRATDAESGQGVAIKTIAPHLTAQRSMVQRFRLESAAARRLEHPNVVRILDAGDTTEGVPYYVMELLQGRELGSVVRNDLAGAAPEELCPMARQLCSALQAAHEAGIVHRDLKPSNVMVLDGGPLTIKLLDFGIAKMLETDEAVQLTATGEVLGDPRFMAPEQLAGEREAIGPRTDLYSLGILFYFIFSGRLPFEARTPGLLMALQLRGKPTPLASLRPDLPRGLLDLTHCCLSRDPALRPSSAAEVLAYLQLEFPPSLEERVEELKGIVGAMYVEARQAKLDALTRMKEAAMGADGWDEPDAGGPAPQVKPAAEDGPGRVPLFPSICPSASPPPLAQPPLLVPPLPLASPSPLDPQQPLTPTAPLAPAPGPPPGSYPEELAGTVILPDEERAELDAAAGAEQEELDYYEMDDMSTTIVDTRKDPQGGK